MIYLGIDPGKEGAIGIIDTIEDTAEVHPYSDDTLMELLHQIGRTRVMVEDVHAMPGQGSTSTFNFGKAFGKILGILKGTHTSYELVTPQKWKKEFSCTSDKNTSIDCCKRLFPTVELKRTDRSRKDDHNMAEAMLICEYARRHMK